MENPPHFRQPAIGPVARVFSGQPRDPRRLSGTRWLAIAKHPMVASILAMSAGVVSGLGFAPYGLWAGTVAGCAWFLWRAAKPQRAGAAFGGGWLFGLGLYGPSLFWLLQGLNHKAEPVLASIPPLLLIAGLALFPAFVAAILAKTTVSRTAKLTLLAPGLWTVAEWLRHQSDVAFPWLTLGYTQIPNGPLASYAPVIGTLGISFLLVLWGGLLVLLAGQDSWVSRRNFLAAVAAVPLVGASLGLVQWTRPVGAPVRAALLQGNAPLLDKFTVAETGRALKTYVDLAAATDAPLVVMPETAFPLFERQIPKGLTQFMASLASERDGDIVVSHFRSNPKVPSQYFSTVHAFGVSGDQSYDKRHLLPFGEFVPFGRLLRTPYERISKVAMLDTSPGARNQDALVLAGHPVALRLCYEDAFGSEHRAETARAGFLLTLVNDSWDGARTPMHQHLQISQARALEAAKPLLRAANTGWTAATDYRGRVTDALPPDTVGALEVTIQPRRGVTPYVYLGDALPMSIALFALLFAGISASCADSSKQPPREVGKP